MAIRSEGLTANSKDTAAGQFRTASEPLNLGNENPDVDLSALCPFFPGSLFTFGYAGAEHGDVPQRNLMAGQIPRYRCGALLAHFIVVYRRAGFIREALDFDHVTAHAV